MKFISVFLFLLITMPCYALEKNALHYIGKQNIYEALLIVEKFVIERNEKHLLKILKDKKFIEHVKNLYQSALYMIADIESSFKYQKGIVDKNDVGIWQINLYWWDIQKLSLFRTVSLEELLRVDTSCEFALYIFIYHASIWYNKSKEKYNDISTITAYHQPNRQVEQYRTKVKERIR